MQKSDPLMRAGHRERLRQKFDAGNASDADEMELLLTYVIQRRDVRVPSRKLIEKFETAYNAMLANPDELKSMPGVGDGVVTFFKLLRSIVLKGYKKLNQEQSLYANDAALQNYCRIQLANKPTEEMHVMYLDNFGRVLYEEINDIGTVNQSNVYPDKILARALITGAVRIVLFHNHPVGDCSPSKADIQTTQKLGEILVAHKIQLYDHLILDNYGNMFSMRASHHFVELDTTLARMCAD